jgi:DNA repair protein RecO (recombination protein O)
VPLVSSRALVLQAFAYSETSKILRLLTETHGLRSVIARGAQRPKSRFGGLLEPFTEGIAQYSLRDSRDLHTLTGFDLVRSRQRLGRDLVAFSGASLLCELVLRFGTEEPAPELFHSIARSLDRLQFTPAERTESAVIAAVWTAVSLLGFRPEMDSCVSCGIPVGSEDAARFDVEAGGIACARCRPGGRRFDPDSRAELLAMVEGIGIEQSLSAPSLQRALLRAFLGAHFGREQPLRSLDLFLQQFP